VDQQGPLAAVAIRQLGGESAVPRDAGAPAARQQALLDRLTQALQVQHYIFTKACHPACTALGRISYVAQGWGGAPGLFVQVESLSFRAG